MGDQTASKSYLDLINDCDNFPWDDPFKPLGNHWSSIYQFHLGADLRPHGLVLESTVKKMPWTQDFKIDHESKKVHLTPLNEDDASISYTTALSKLIQRAIDEDTFAVIHGQHSEPYAIMGANFPASVERYASHLLGIVSRGAHLTVYTNTREGMKIWVPRRSPKLFTYPNCLDTTVAGGVAAGEGPFECIIREAEEEASLSEGQVRKDTVATGCISYIGLNDSRGGGEMGLICPTIIYVYDLEVGEDIICRQNDDEVKEFYLMNVNEVKDALFRGEFKTNSAVIMIDFLIRHGVITSENEKHYAEIMARMHRKLPLPTAPEDI
ncbi:Thiamine pyrophosphokinase [Hyphodiscus hymeniophilus]|uniref:Thiamine pyrophosphokinase n=1 Tax=Hyphodiscus hymeniophilus TaxID=353542 RepID=A0A9P7AWI6_9HELO|nr:Thiamine pyrophosphokinase [Hyphodiscus hymeniophilus]